MAWTSRDQYEELQELGRGGFGQAKLIKKNVGQDQLFVVKEVNLTKLAESCGDDPGFVNKVIEMTKLEAANMMGLQHDNIVRVYGFFEEIHLKCQYYHIVMEYCELGRCDELNCMKKQPTPLFFLLWLLGDLAKLIREAAFNGIRFDERQIRKWAKQLVSAVKFLHENEFVHRDIKPAV